MYPVTYREILRIVKGEVLSTPIARKIMRKADVRLGSAVFRVPEGPVLSIPDVVVVGGCPRFPYPPDLYGADETQIADFYDLVALAETGDPGALEDLRNQLNAWGYGMPDFFSETATIIIRGACPVVVEISRLVSAPFFEVTSVVMNGARGPLSAGTYWHPLDLEGYVTRWDFSQTTEVMTLATIADAPLGADATLRPVYAATYADLIAGDWDYLTSGIPCSTAGVFKTAWESVPSEATDDVFVAFVLEVASTVSALTMGVVEVRAR